MKFEFDIEVRPEFDLPNWKGLTIERPMREFSEADVDTQLKQLLSNQGQLMPHDGAAAAGDFVTLKVTARNGDEVLSDETHDGVCIRTTLSFRDGRIDGFDKLMKGVKAGDKKTATSKSASTPPNEELRGKKVKVEFEVLDVKKLELPELNAEFLRTIGDFESEKSCATPCSAAWSGGWSTSSSSGPGSRFWARSPWRPIGTCRPEMLERQAGRELERHVMELRRSGFSDDEIRAHANELRQNSKQIDGQGAEGALHPGEARREEKIEAAAGRLRRRNQADRRAERRERPPGCGPRSKSAA